MSSRLDAAENLIQRGFHLFVLLPGSKLVPREMEGYPTRATRDKELFRRWTWDPLFEEVRNFNIGVSTSRFQDDRALIVVDKDDKPGRDGSGTLLRLELEGSDLPSTLTVATPSGGEHFYYWSDHPVRPGVDLLGPGLDVRSKGGYVVGPGSETEQGCYAITNDLAVAQAPDWLVERCGPPGESRANVNATPPDVIDRVRATTRAVRYLTADAPSPLHGRNDAAYEVACRVMDFGLDAADTLELMEAHWLPRLPDPLDVDELGRTVRKASKYRRNQIGDAAPEVMFADEPEPPPPVVHRDTKSAKQSLPVVFVGLDQLRDEARNAWAAVHRANEREAQLFQRGGRLIRLIADSESAPIIQPVDPDWLIGYLSRVANWLRETKRGQTTAAKPGLGIAKDMLAFPDPTLPRLDSVGTIPIITASGNLVGDPGYSPEAAYYLHRADSTQAASLPERPSPAELDAARALLCEDLLGDFPFEGPADRAHVLAAMLLPLVRRMIDGCTPLHLLEAPEAGSGKTLIASVVSLVTTGELGAMRTLPLSEDEIRKALISELSTGRAIIVLDNARDTELSSSALASTLTSDTMTDRLLTTNTMLTCPNRSLWMMTGNNPRLSKELTRRCIRIRIDSKESKPWLREGFRHSNLLGWTRENRGKLLQALLTMVAAWIEQGRPRPRSMQRPLGSFEQWSYVIGGILETTGVPDFLGNLHALYATNDSESRDWEAFLTAWWEVYGTEPVTAAALAALCESQELMTSARGSGNSQSQRSRVGRALQKAEGRVYLGLRLSTAMRPPGGSHTHHYRLQRTDDTDPFS